MSKINKIILLGDSNTGKSSIVNRKVYSKFEHSIQSSVGVAYNNIKLDDYSLNLWDTAGQERFKSIIPIYLKGADVCVIVYDLTNKESMENVNDWIDQVINLITNPIIIIVGNKIDVENKPKFYIQSDYPIIYTSAKTNYNIDKLFLSIISLLKEKETNKKTNINICDLIKLDSFKNFDWFKCY